MGNWRELADQTVMSNEEKELVKEVLRLKHLLDVEAVAGDDCKSWLVCETIKKLQRMGLSLRVLKETMIGQSVRPFKKHSSKYVSTVSRLVIKDWIRVACEWVDTNYYQGEPLRINPIAPSDDKSSLTTVSDAMTSARNIHHQPTASTNLNSSVIHGQRPTVSGATSHNHKTFLIHGQRTRPIASDALIHAQHRSPIDDSYAVTSYHKGGFRNTTEEKMESTRTKLQERYKELEQMRQKRKIQVIELSQLPKDGGVPPRPAVNKRLKR